MSQHEQNEAAASESRESSHKSYTSLGGSSYNLLSFIPMTYPADVGNWEERERNLTSDNMDYKEIISLVLFRKSNSLLIQNIYVLSFLILKYHITVFSK